MGQTFAAGHYKLTGYHLLFGLAFIFGLVTLRTLKAVHETGATRREAIWPVLESNISTRFHRLNPAPYMTFLNAFQFGLLRKLPGTVEAIDITPCGKAEKETLQIAPVTLRELEKKPPSCTSETVVL